MNIQKMTISIVTAGLLASSALFAEEKPAPKPAAPAKEVKIEKPDDKAASKKPAAPKGTMRPTKTKDGY